MDYKTAEVVLTVDIRGTQASRGQYTHFHKVSKDGKDVNGLTTVIPPKFTDCKKTIRLGNGFVRGALEEGPLDMSIRKRYWVTLPAEKRIRIHVRSLVRAMHPENRGYTAEII